MTDNVGYEWSTDIGSSFSASGGTSKTNENQQQTTTTTFAGEAKTEEIGFDVKDNEITSFDGVGVPKPYAGMPKEILLHYSRQKKFVWARNILTSAVILTILILLAMVISLIAVSPACQQFWQTSPIYQIYPKSFKDSNNDGIGDLQGIKEKIGYLKDLGIETVWLNPIYKSPQADNGYDVSDYRTIDEQFGTMDDLVDLVNELHSEGMKIVMDFVPNHSSNQHMWFNASSNPTHDQYEKYKDYYIWVNSTDGTRNGIPNNWQSVFSQYEESAWEWNDNRQQFYYHAFLKEQPDLNARNPAVLQELKDILEFWLQKNVDGFRVDSIKYLYEATHLRNNPQKDPTRNESDLTYEDLWGDYTENQFGIHDVIADWRSLLKKYSSEPGVYRFMETEVYDPSIDVIVRYYGTPHVKEADFPMNFELIELGDKNSWNSTAVEATLMKWMVNMPAGKWPNWVIGNHDNYRTASRLGEEKAKLAAVLTMTLSGTPGMYYGEELGMTDNDKTNSADFRDPERTPMQWDDTDNAGFCANCTPWLPVNENYATLNVKAQNEDSSSTLSLYKTLISMRSENVFLRGSLCVLHSTDKTVLFVREMPGTRSILVALNFQESGLDQINLIKSYPGKFPELGSLVFSSDLSRELEVDISLEDVQVPPSEAWAIRFKPGGRKALFTDSSSPWANRCFTSKRVCVDVLGLLEVC